MEYAVVDIETTGSHSGFDKITEVAIVIHSGKKITGRFQTLVNPEVSIPPWISSLTGITNEMVADAPRFYEVAKEIWQELEGRIFVAHNVNFDYNFIRQEFRSLGSDLNLKKLCIVRLSRKIFPGLPSYSLGNLCRKLGITIHDRHRAYGDAEATARVLALLIKNDSEGHIEGSLKKSAVEANLPPNLPREQYDSLPEEPGVYYFFDSKGKVIYVGKANHIKSRIKGHFTPGSDTSSRRKMMDDICGISYELCGNELISLLFESHEIKRLWPVYNRTLKRARLNYGIYPYEDRQGYKRFSISRIMKDGVPVISFASLPEARSFMQRKIMDYSLCSKLAGLQNTPGACFDYNIRQCGGACIGEEKPRAYNKRVNKFLKSLETANLSVIILGKGRSGGESSAVWVENGSYKGFGFFDSAANALSADDLKTYIKPYPDNQDIQHIIQVYLRRDKQYQVIPLNGTEVPLF